MRGTGEVSASVPAQRAFGMVERRSGAAENTPGSRFSETFVRREIRVRPLQRL